MPPTSRPRRIASAVYTVDEVANLFSVSIRTLERQIARGRFPRALPAFGARRWAKKDVDAVLNRRAS